MSDATDFFTRHATALTLFERHGRNCGTLLSRIPWDDSTRDARAEAGLALHTADQLAAARRDGDSEECMAIIRRYAESVMPWRA